MGGVGGYGYFKILNNGGMGKSWKNLHGRLRHNAGEVGGGGNPFQSKFGVLVPQKILNKTFNFWRNVPELALDKRLFFWFETQNINTPNETFYWMNKKFYVMYLYFEFKTKKIILTLVKNHTEFLCFSSLWLINTEKISLLLMCSVKKRYFEGL